jgi:NRPS condensation-like uncharacterized protein
VEFGIEYYDFSTGDTAGKIIRDFIRPFDLSQAPLLRVGLIKTGEENHILIVDMHHIISDGTSMSLIIEDFMRLYAGNTLPKLCRKYAAEVGNPV